MIEKDAGARAAIEYAKGWELTKYNPAMQRDLEKCLSATGRQGDVTRKVRVDVADRGEQSSGGVP